MNLHIFRWFGKSSKELAKLVGECGQVEEVIQ